MIRVGGFNELMEFAAAAQAAVKADGEILLETGVSPAGDFILLCRPGGEPLAFPTAPARQWLEQFIAAIERGAKRRRAARNLRTLRTLVDALDHLIAEAESRTATTH